MDHLRRGLAGTRRWKGCWAALAAAAVLGLAVAGAQTVLFTDDFEDGNANGWTVFGGSWSVPFQEVGLIRASTE